MPATTWNPNDKSTGITLSNGSLTATAASGTNPGVRATRLLTGKSYWEVTASVESSTFAIGFANWSWNPSSGTLLGGDNNGLSLRQDGTVKLNNVNLTTIFTFAQGDIIQVAVDIQNRLVWFNKNNGNWNNSASASPSSGTGGIDYSSMAWNSVVPAFGAAVVTPNQAAIAAFSSSGWTYSAPSGFSSVDSCQAFGVTTDLPSALGPYFGAARRDAVTVTAQKTQFPTATGAWYGIAKNTPATWTRQWSPAAAQTKVSGTVTENGAPVAKKVRLYDHNTGEFLGETTSDPATGAYAIPALGRGKTVPVAFDDPSFNALIYDNVVPL